MQFNSKCSVWKGKLINLMQPNYIIITQLSKAYHHTYIGEGIGTQCCKTLGYMMMQKLRDHKNSFALRNNSSHSWHQKEKYVSPMVFIHNTTIHLLSDNIIEIPPHILMKKREKLTSGYLAGATDDLMSCDSWQIINRMCWKLRSQLLKPIQ